jgi:hypothetical protein
MVRGGSSRKKSERFPEVLGGRRLRWESVWNGGGKVLRCQLFHFVYLKMLNQKFDFYGFLFF